MKKLIQSRAVLTPYTSLRSFKEWQFNNNLDFKPLDYSTCTLYTEDLFSAYMSYKLIWKKINNSVWPVILSIVRQYNNAQLR